MKKNSILLASALILLSFSPAFAQEESLFQIQAARQNENSANAKVLNELREQTEAKSASIISRNRNRTNPENLILNTETLKQQYLSLVSATDTDADEFVLELQARCEEEIQARILEEQRMAELEADGVTLNARGQKRLENDIAGIRAKYQAQIDGHKKSSSRKNDGQALLAQIGGSIKTLESSSYTQSSISDRNLSLSIGQYDGSREAWPYTVQLSLAGQEVASYSGSLSYTDISGKPIPEVPAYTENAKDPKLTEYRNYLDSVEIFDEAFRTGPLFIEAQISYTVKACEPSRASAYEVRVSSVTLRNIISDRTVSTYSGSDSTVFAYSPASYVDWTASAKAVPPKTAAEKPAEKKADSRTDTVEASVNATLNLFPPITITINMPDRDENERSSQGRREQKKKEAETKETVKNSNQKASPAKENINSVQLPETKKTVSALLYCLPGTLNCYVSDSGGMALTIGYNMQFTVSPRLFLGVNLEFGGTGQNFFANRYADDDDTCSPAKNIYYYEEPEPYDCEEILDDGFYLLTAQIGSFVSLNRNIRFNYFGEAGLCSDYLALGGGCSFEFYSNTLHLGTTVGYTGLLLDNLNYLHKLSFGIEVLF